MSFFNFLKVLIYKVQNYLILLALLTKMVVKFSKGNCLERQEEIITLLLVILFQ